MATRGLVILRSMHAGAATSPAYSRRVAISTDFCTRQHTDSSVRSDMFGFGSKSLGDEETQSLKKLCKTSLSAYSGCLKANPDDPSACEHLHNATMYCLAQRKCPEQAKAYRTCFSLMHTRATTQGRLRIYEDAHACDSHIEALRKCLNKCGAYHLLAST